MLGQREKLNSGRRESQREQRAGENGGEYYERDPLAAALIALDEEKAARAAARARTNQLEAELAALRASYLYSKGAASR